MDGELTMHGVTKAMTLPLVLYPPRRNVSQQLILIGKAPIRIARKDFGITGGANYNPWFNAARMALMADSVDLTIEAQAWLSDAASQRVPPVVEALERVKTQGISAQLDRFRAQIAGKPDSALMGYIAGADYLVRELLEENPAAALSLASELPRLYKGWRAYAISGHALAVTGDSVGAERQYAEARRLFKRKPADPDGLIDNEWYYLDELARASIERGHVRAAIGVAALSADLFPDMSRGLATYGWALHLAGDDTKAVQQFARALEVNPNETRALELRRRIHP
jgi:tetratricopeptide (TPR) repeat protein